MITALRGWTGLLLLLVFTRAACSQACPHRTDLGNSPRHYTGLYKNPAFGYETHLPAGTIGLDSDNPEYQRGFVVLLPQAGGTLSVYAEPNSAEYKTAAAAVGTDLDYLRTDRTQATVLHRTATHLDSHPAAELAAEFRCPNDPKLYRHLAAFSLGTNHRFLYTLTWEGPADRAPEAASLLHAIELSWKFIRAR